MLSAIQRRIHLHILLFPGAGRGDNILSSSRIQVPFVSTCYCLRSNLFQGIAKPVFIANTSAGKISMDDEMPAVTNKHCHSSSLRVRTSFWMRADASPPTIVKIVQAYRCHQMVTIGHT